MTAQLCHSDAALAATPKVRFSFCLLDDLRDHGPFASIFTEPDDPDVKVDWLGQRSDQAPESVGQAVGDA